MLSITQRQLNLYYFGHYYTGKIDGIEGPQLRTAYGKFQQAKGLKVDKLYGPKTDAMLIETVKELQRKLNAHGANLAVDGKVGDNTIAAIKAYQKANGLVVDGIAGSRTMALLSRNTLSWDNIKYFRRSEFRCNCKGYCDGFPVDIDIKLVKLLDDLRAYFGVPITVTSGVRCAKRNKEVGGISSSMHLKGKAADIYVPGVSRAKVKAKAYELGAEYSYYGTPGMGNAVHINI